MVRPIGGAPSELRFGADVRLGQQIGGVGQHRGRRIGPTAQLPFKKKMPAQAELGRGTLVSRFMGIFFRGPG